MTHEELIKLLTDVFEKIAEINEHLIKATAILSTRLDMAEDRVKQLESLTLPSITFGGKN